MHRSLPAPRRPTILACLLTAHWLGAACAAPAELLDNRGFESALDGWKTSFADDEGGFAASTHEPHSGKSCAHLKLDEGVAGLDHARKLVVGRDLRRSRRYTVSAWMKNAGMSAGDFGLRVYFYGWDAEYLTMISGMGVRPGMTPFGWKQFTTEFGAGTDKPIPTGARTCLIRFSLWDKDNKGSGEVWLDDVSLTEDASYRPQPRTGKSLGIWIDPALAVRPATDPEALTKLLSSKGFHVTRLSTDDLTATKRLDPLAFNTLVIPYAEVYPAVGWPALEAFLSSGGAYLSLEGRSLAVPIYRGGDGWHRIDEVGETAASLPPDTAWDSSHRGDEEAMTVDANDGTFRLHTRDLKAYQYAGCELPPLPADAATLVFTAKGDANTPLLCLELREDDASRWKYAIPLTEDWKEHRLNLGALLAYNTEERGTDGDHFQPQNAESLWLGFTRAMVGAGPHDFAVRDVRFTRSPVAPGAVANAAFRDSGQALAIRYFGSDLAAAAVNRHLSCFHSSTRVEGAVASAGKPPALFPATTRASSLGAWTLAAPPMATPGKSAASVATTRLVPLLHTVNDGRPVAGMVMHYAGRMAGSIWAVIGTEGVNLLGDDLPGMREGLVDLCGFLCDGVVWGDPALRFRAEDQRVLLSFACPVINRARKSIRLTATTSIAGPAGKENLSVAVDLDPEAVDELVMAEQPVAPDGWQKMSLQSSLALDGKPLTRLQWSLDTKQALRDVGDWFVELSNDTGKFCGTSFVDNRGARGLLGAYEILGDERYLNAALAWGRKMIEEQREDGGYRMGYGITSKGESCYVADGGEIAVGMARLVSYTEGDEQRHFFDSLKRYMAYRDSFRVPTGGIGVGWCLHDYGQRPIVPLDTPTRIFAPEKNTYTIGCTLAAAYAYARLTGDPDDEAAAQRDAEWLMARAKTLNGAFVESYLFAHAFTTDEGQRHKYEDFLREHFVEPMCANDTAWWRVSAGRCALNLDGLVYCHERLGKDPRMAAQIARATHALFSPESPDSLYRVREQGPLDTNRGIYACFSYCCLPDVIQPMITMKPFDVVAHRAGG